jgi:hypothetical protein
MLRAGQKGNVGLTLIAFDQNWRLSKEISPRRKHNMRQYFLLVAAGLVLAGPSASFVLAQANGDQATSHNSSAKLTNSDIVEMSKAGLSVDVIAAKMQDSDCSFDTSPAALVALKSAGVPDSIILAIVKSPHHATPKEVPTPSAAPTQPGTNSGTPEVVKTTVEAPSKGCIAVKSIGSHALRNIMLAGVAGAIISKQQYQVVDAVGYPARVGQKYHGNDLQTIQASGTKVAILGKYYTNEEFQKACH